MIFSVTYPGGEQTYGIGYPGTTLVIEQVPPGPESCLGDVLEVAPDPVGSTNMRVVRIVGGPRRPTHRVRVVGGAAAREAWMAAHEARGWTALDGHDPDPDVVWVVALVDGLDPATLGDVIAR